MTAALFVATSAGTAGIGLTAVPAGAATCSDVDIVFARGNGEAPGLGITGTPFVNSLRQNLSGKTVSSYAVNHAADIAQTSAGPGATDMTRHVRSVAASCPNTTFALGGATFAAAGCAHRADGTTRPARPHTDRADLVPSTFHRRQSPEATSLPRRVTSHRQAPNATRETCPPTRSGAPLGSNTGTFRGARRGRC